MTTLSPEKDGMVETRRSTLDLVPLRSTVTWKLPSCGRRRSEMSSWVRILMREMISRALLSSACCVSPKSAGRSTPSTRNRIWRPVASISRWMSLQPRVDGPAQHMLEQLIGAPNRLFVELDHLRGRRFLRGFRQHEAGVLGFLVVVQAAQGPLNAAARGRDDRDGLAGQARDVVDDRSLGRIVHRDRQDPVGLRDGQ
jgi:hypothetical protein